MDKNNHLYMMSVAVVAIVAIVALVIGIDPNARNAVSVKDGQYGFVPSNVNYDSVADKPLDNTVGRAYAGLGSGETEFYYIHDIPYELSFVSADDECGKFSVNGYLTPCLGSGEMDWIVGNTMFGVNSYLSNQRQAIADFYFGHGVVDVRGEGVESYYTINCTNTTSYELVPVFIYENCAKFSLNGEISPCIPIGENWQASDGALINVVNIFVNQRDSAVKFALIHGVSDVLAFNHNTGGGSPIMAKQPAMAAMR